jgi:hypothetical protein
MVFELQVLHLQPSEVSAQIPLQPCSQLQLSCIVGGGFPPSCGWKGWHSARRWLWWSPNCWFRGGTPQYRAGGGRKGAGGENRVVKDLAAGKNGWKMDEKSLKDLSMYILRNHTTTFIYF